MSDAEDTATAAEAAAALQALADAALHTENDGGVSAATVRSTITTLTWPPNHIQDADTLLKQAVDHAVNVAWSTSTRRLL